MDEWLNEVRMINLDGQCRSDQKIVVDGGSFVGATLNRCLLVYRGGDIPNVSGLKINDCQWSFEGMALNTLLMLALLRWGHPEKVQELLRDADAELREAFLSSN